MSTQQGTAGEHASPQDLSGDYSPQSLDALIEDRGDYFGARLCSLWIGSKYQRIF